MTLSPHASILSTEQTNKERGIDAVHAHLVAEESSIPTEAGVLDGALGARYKRELPPVAKVCLNKIDKYRGV